MLISKVMKEEEDSFLRTLETGIRLLDRVMAETRASEKTVIDGVEPSRCSTPMVSRST